VKERFWKWRSYFTYLKYLAAITLGMLVLVMIFRNNAFFIVMLGTLSAAIEVIIIMF
jgi:hypothetical protein